MTIDYYRVLNVPRDATMEMLHSAYRRLARQYHPDRNPGPEAADLSRHMVLVNEAYSCLRNTSSRQAYNRNLRIAEPVALQIAILNAADQLIRRSGWEHRETGRRNKIFQKGSRRVAVRLLRVLDEEQLERWIRSVEQLLKGRVADWAVVLAYRLLAVDEFEQTSSLRIRQATAIDLIDSRAYGDGFPDSEYAKLFQSFLID